MIPPRRVVVVMDGFGHNNNNNNKRPLLLRQKLLPLWSLLACNNNNNNSRWSWLAWLAALLQLQCSCLVPAAATGQNDGQQQQHGDYQRPNIVILLADNLGFADVGLYENANAANTAAAQTPAVNSLGRDGLVFTQWNSAAHLCSASRAALLTGKYPVKTGIYPAVFTPDAVYGLLPTEMILSKYLKQTHGYACHIVGKWHLGHRRAFLPVPHHGFDDWLGIPYHMSGGSVDNHTCNADVHETMWLPLYHKDTIVEQPVNLSTLASRYANAAVQFIHDKASSQTPFFLYMAFSHVHQLCAPADWPEQETCQWSAATKTAPSSPQQRQQRQPQESNFVSAVEEMDWIVRQILQTLDEAHVANDTIVLFTSDNGPWTAEQQCSGSKGPFQGKWLQGAVPLNCTACPHDYVPAPTADLPRRCVLQKHKHHQKKNDHNNNNLDTRTKQYEETMTRNKWFELDGVHCGEDTGLGSLWEANLRMPAVVRWPGHIPAGTTTRAVVSTLDVFPTLLTLVDPVNAAATRQNLQLDGIDTSAVWLGKDKQDDEKSYDSDNRVLFFWRDGFATGPLGPPYGRFDVAAVKVGPIKAWFSTKSAHYNDDVEQYHDPPLLFDTDTDPAEAFPLNPADHVDLIAKIKQLVVEHKASIDWTYPLTLAKDPQYIPCVDKATNCRTVPATNHEKQSDPFPRQDSANAV